MEWKPHISLKSIIIKNISLLSSSQTLYFLFKVRRPWVIKNKLQEIYWPPAQGVVVGEEENRWSVGTSLRATETCFSQEKQITIGWMVIILSHHVNDSSRSCHASRSVCRCPEALTATLSIVIHIESAANLWTWDGVILQACVALTMLIIIIFRIGV